VDSERLLESLGLRERGDLGQQRLKAERSFDAFGEVVGEFEFDVDALELGKCCLHLDCVWGRFLVNLFVSNFNVIAI
jgi:hypothetical protein